MPAIPCVYSACIGEGAKNVVGIIRSVLTPSLNFDFFHKSVLCPECIVSCREEDMSYSAKRFMIPLGFSSGVEFESSRRVAFDGLAYTFSEFREAYGQEHGDERWLMAPPEDFTPRATDLLHFGVIAAQRCGGGVVLLRGCRQMIDFTTDCLAGGQRMFCKGGHGTDVLSLGKFAMVGLSDDRKSADRVYIEPASMMPWRT